MGVLLVFRALRRQAEQEGHHRQEGGDSEEGEQVEIFAMGVHERGIEVRFFLEAIGFQDFPDAVFPGMSGIELAELGGVVAQEFFPPGGGQEDSPVDFLVDGVVSPVLEIHPRALRDGGVRAEKDRCEAEGSEGEGDGQGQSGGQAAMACVGTGMPRTMAAKQMQEVARAQKAVISRVFTVCE